MIEREIKSFILRALLAAKGEPMTSDSLKASIAMAFNHVTFTSADLSGYIKDCEDAGWITGTSDDLLGVVWALTLKGKTRAQQLR